VSRYLQEPDPISGEEPQLGIGERPDLSGLEPLLGGERRIGADPERIQLLLNATPRQRESISEYIRELGQQPVYAAEIAKTLSQDARHQRGNYRGIYTIPQRLNAIEALGKIGSYESLIPLMESLADDEFAIRKSAAQALRQIAHQFDPDDKRTVFAYRVMVTALSSLPAGARKPVTHILSAAPADLVLGSLLKVGLQAEAWQVRREAAWTLGALGDERATRRLIAALRDEVGVVRSTVAWALGQLEAPPAIQPLMHVLRDDPDEVVRAAAVEALGQQVARLSLLDAEFKPTLKEIVGAFEDRDAAVRQAAIDALSAVNTPYTRNLLRQMVVQNAERFDRQ